MTNNNSDMDPHVLIFGNGKAHKLFDMLMSHLQQREIGTLEKYRVHLKLKTCFWSPRTIIPISLSYEPHLLFKFLIYSKVWKYSNSYYCKFYSCILLLMHMVFPVGSCKYIFVFIVLSQSLPFLIDNHRFAYLYQDQFLPANCSPM